MAENRAKMSPHSRAALEAADTIKNVISSFNDTAFMSESTSDQTARTRARIEASPDALTALEQGLTQSYAERIARAMEK